MRTIMTTMGRSRGRTRSGTRKEAACEETPLFFAGLMLWYAAIDNMKIHSRVSFFFFTLELVGPGLT